jgi:hypothetical protein
MQVACYKIVEYSRFAGQDLAKQPMMLEFLLASTRGIKRILRANSVNTRVELRSLAVRL